MGHLLRAYSLVLGIASLTGTLAQVCTSSSRSYHISSQDQLDVLAQNCTIIDSPFYVQSNYTGSSFILHNVTNISQSLNFEWSDTSPRSSLSIEFPDLIRAKSIFLSDVSSLTKLSLPKLEYTDYFSMSGPWEMPDLEFPSLRNTSAIRLQGNISRVSFPALKTVHGDLLIDNAIEPFMKMKPNTTTVDLSLPVLEKAYNIEVRGKVANMSAPELTAVNSLNADLGMLTLDLQGDAKALSLPKLSSVGGRIDISGNLSSLSLPSLRTLPPYFTIWPRAPLDIELPVESGERIEIGGAVKSVSLPNLRNFTHIDVGSTAGINCDSLIRDLKENVTAAGGDEDGRMICHSAAGVLRALGTQAVLAIAVVITWVEFF